MADENERMDWGGAARRLRSRLPGFPQEAVRAALAEAGRARVVVACSGGADSLSLLLALAAEPEVLCDLVVAHYNHRWRGGDSDADASFVREVALGLDLPYEEAIRPPEEAAFTETTARELRLAFLRQVAAEHDCGFIAFGHQREDILETQLQRLARGAGAEGLAAPRPVHAFEGLPTHLRPLLDLRAGDLRMALNASGIPWREDVSNRDMRIARNVLRQRVIPDLAEATGRDVSAGAARSRKLLAEDAEALDRLARRECPGAYAGAPELAIADLRRLPAALARRALSRWLHDDEGIRTISAPVLDELLETIFTGRAAHRISVADGFIRIRGGRLTVTPSGNAAGPFLSEAVLRAGESVLLSTGAAMTAESVAVDAALRDRLARGEVDPAKEACVALDPSASLRIRPRRPGDRYRPLGAPGSRKLQDCLTDAGIPARERDALPVVIDKGGRPVWVPGLPPVDAVRIAPATMRALRLTYRSRNSP